MHIQGLDVQKSAHGLDVQKFVLDWMFRNLPRAECSDIFPGLNVQTSAQWLHVQKSAQELDFQKSPQRLDVQKFARGLEVQKYPGDWLFRNLLRAECSETSPGACCS